MSENRKQAAILAADVVGYSRLASARAWRDVVARLKLPMVRFHDLRQTHVYALIAGGLDVVAISRRLGHASPVVTLSVYARLFKQSDDGAAAAIEAAMRTGAEQ
jgi:integrase